MFIYAGKTGMFPSCFGALHSAFAVQFSVSVLMLTLLVVLIVL
jgi:hypothetical protein